VTRHQVIWLDSGHRVIWQGSGLRVNRHVRQWAPGQNQALDCLARQRASDRHQVWTAGTGSPGIRSFGSPAGTASSGKAVGTESTGIIIGSTAGIESTGRHRIVTGWISSTAGQEAPGHLTGSGSRSPGIVVGLS
ncbi:unnamed protein product, partial [Staurois parvus]